MTRPQSTSFPVLPAIVDRVNTSFFPLPPLPPHKAGPDPNGGGEIELKSGFYRFFPLFLPQVRILICQLYS
jgi:hypothetical protein